MAGKTPLLLATLPAGGTCARRARRGGDTYASGLGGFVLLRAGQAFDWMLGGLVSPVSWSEGGGDWAASLPLPLLGGFGASADVAIFLLPVAAALAGSP